ncbi:hypothetical protein VNO80_26939 [Phaseolus coccineus]|uniref:Uncharacterized protein n=1 Tax=Phaseolus coccineus TaxID=3886 RepID=A0AAN9QKY3_PHACN
MLPIGANEIGARGFQQFSHYKTSRVRFRLQLRTAPEENLKLELEVRKQNQKFRFLSCLVGIGSFSNFNLEFTLQGQFDENATWLEYAFDCGAHPVIEISVVG